MGSGKIMFIDVGTNRTESRSMIHGWRLIMQPLLRIYQNINWFQIKLSNILIDSISNLVQKLYPFIRGSGCVINHGTRLRFFSYRRRETLFFSDLMAYINRFIESICIVPVWRTDKQQLLILFYIYKGYGCITHKWGYGSCSEICIRELLMQCCILLWI